MSLSGGGGSGEGSEAGNRADSMAGTNTPGPMWSSEITLKITFEKP